MNTGVMNLLVLSVLGIGYMFAFTKLHEDSVKELLREVEANISS